MSGNGNIGFFKGTPNGVTARHFIKDFELYLASHGFYDNNALTVRLFKTRMDGAAEVWYSSLPADVKASWERLEAAFLDHFDKDVTLGGAKQTRYQRYYAHLNPSLDLLRNPEEWDAWLQRLYELASEVPTDFSSPQALAFAAWTALPPEIQSVIAVPSEGTVADFVNACRSVPQQTYDRILADHDQREEIVKEIRLHKQREAEIESKLRNEMDEKLRKAMEAYSQRDALPPSPPLEQGFFPPQPQFRPPQQPLPSPPRQQQSLPPFQRRLISFPRPASPPPSTRERFHEIRQLTYPDSSEGHAQYREAMRDFAQRHPRVSTQPPLDEPYPLTPGTQPAGSNECHRCGQRGHFVDSCPNAPVPQAEQTYRRMYGAGTRNKRRQEKF